MPSPTIADRKETQSDHPDGNKDENANEDQPNYMHVVHTYP
jgi:hypothetical protein